MAITTKKTNSTATRTSSEIDLFENLTVSRATKRETAEVVGEILIQEINRDLNDQKSPVSGTKFRGLSKGYKKIKTGRGEPGVPNLELTGSMRDSLDVRVGASGQLEIGVFGPDAGKADGHNNFSGDSSLPLRQFLPREGEEFRSGIRRKINEVIAEAVAKDVKLPVKRLQEATSKSSFFQILREFFPGMSNREIESSILTNPDLVRRLRDLGLLGFLSGNGN